MRIGVDLGATNIRVGIVEAGVIYRMITEPFPHDKPEKDTIKCLIGAIRKIMNSNIKGIGIGVPSIVDTRHGIVYNAVNIPSWKEVHLKEILEHEFRVPVIVNNDCNCFTFGERYYGEATIYHNIVGVTLGTGLGAGIIINNMLYEGMNTSAGEIGSLPYLDSDYENYCASNFFDKYKTTGYNLYLRAKDGEQEALSVWGIFGYHVGNLIKAILLTYDPEAIVIGGSIAKARHYFDKAMYKQLSTFLYPHMIKNVEILFSKKEDIGLLGAAALIP
ncbi:ROK family protein [Dysgonomonas capnocytophagoides]|uniref:ROK family protein n=1 Tax=Dysgonomonas capnocytophagoides TaxID=45254 RepID=UPI00333F46F4